MVVHRTGRKLTYVKVAGIIADLYPPNERGLPMSLFATASFSGGLGEMVACLLLRRNSWRWIHWHQLIINCPLMVLIAVFFEESRSPDLLSGKAKPPDAHAVEHGGTDEEREKPAHSKAEEVKQRDSLAGMIRSGLTLPFCMSFSKPSAVNSNRTLGLLCKEPVVFWFSMWMSFSWALLFL